MFIPNTGLYIDDGNKAFEAETNYHLNFQIISALISIDFITNCKNNNIGPFENKAQYYHFYVDHLLYSLGQISERFHVVEQPRTYQIEYNERRKQNRINYNFNEVTFPILSNKDYRNTITHIDEYDINVISSYMGVGGFNYIDSETPDSLKETLLSNRYTHIYTLDLLSGNIYITRNDNELTLCIADLRKELNQLHDTVSAFADYLTII